MLFTKKLISEAKKIITLASKHQIKITTAESCTGGLLSALFTEISGSSKAFECGFVTYSNEAKATMLKISPDLIAKYGAVSRQTAKAMAIQSTKNSLATISVAITGIAGPQGGSKAKPIGLVYIASYNQQNKKLILKKFNFKGLRSTIREQSLIAAIAMLESQFQ